MPSLPPFPVDPTSLDLLDAAVRPDAALASRTSLSEVCAMFAELVGAGSGTEYHHNDVIAALIDEVRRLRRP